jgi:hypothetical protein
LNRELIAKSIKKPTLSVKKESAKKRRDEEHFGSCNARASFLSSLFPEDYASKIISLSSSSRITFRQSYSAAI